MAYNHYQPVPTEEKLSFEAEVLPEIDRLPPCPDLSVSHWETFARISVAIIAGLGTGSVLGIGSGVMAKLAFTLLQMGIGVATVISLPLSIWFTLYYYKAFTKDDDALREHFEEYNAEINKIRNDYKRKLFLYARLWKKILKKAACFSPEELENMVDDPQIATNTYILQLLYSYSKHAEYSLNPSAINGAGTPYGFDTLLEKYPAALPIQRHHPEIQHRGETIQSGLLHRKYLGPLASFVGACGLGAGFYALSVAVLGATIPPLGVGLGIVACCLVVAASAALLHRYVINKLNKREESLKQYERDANETVRVNMEKLDQLGEQLTRVKIKLDDKNDREEEITRPARENKPQEPGTTPVLTLSHSTIGQPTPSLRRRFTRWFGF